MLLAIYDTHLDQLIIIANFQYFCNFCFKCKCIFPVFHKQVFLQLLFFLYLDFYPIVDVTDSCSCFILMLMMSESKLTAHPGASPCLAAHALLPSHILKYFPLCLSSLHHAPWPLSSSRWVPALKPKISKLHLLISAAAPLSFSSFYFLLNFVSLQPKFYWILNE